MCVSPESASSSGVAAAVRASRLLVVAPSWLGDCVMAMPAMAALRRHAPGASVTVLAKRSVADLWRLFPRIDEVVTMATGMRGTLDTIRRMREGRFEMAYVLPRSFRSAVIPFSARVPCRRGLTGHARDWMLTEAVRWVPQAGCGHQWQEYLHLFGFDARLAAMPPFLAISGEDMERARRRIFRAWQDRVGSLEAPRVAAFFPGAARGPSKCWPEDSFVELGKRLLGQQACRVLVLGSQRDRAVCGQVAGAIGRGAINLAGETSLGMLAALLRLSRVVVANDSGGMHLAVAVGARVVGLFGVTDPVRTGPLGEGHRVIAARGVVRSRDVPRDAEWARNAMASIGVPEVHEAAAEILESGGEAPDAVPGHE